MKINLSPDNTVFTFINKIVDVMWLSILWSLISLPLMFGLVFLFLGFINPDLPYMGLENIGILTPIVAIPIACFPVGPASAALYYAIVKVVRRERGYATRQFFHGLKENFKHGALSSLAYGLFIGVLFVDLFLAPMTMNNDTMVSILTGVLYVNAILALFMLTWINPLLSRFNVTMKELFKNSFITAVRCMPRTLIMAAFWAGIVYVLWNFSGAYVFMLPFFLPGVSALLRSFIIEPVFKKMVGDQSDAEASGVDAWYAE
ncbi:MAG: DUF624 domain-containing protein [Lachnospiraceae bacterium]|nr:DUF624 domain-containing protein [Lachnospiraceae bacterium]